MEIKLTGSLQSANNPNQSHYAITLWHVNYLQIGQTHRRRMCVRANGIYPQALPIINLYWSLIFTRHDSWYAPHVLRVCGTRIDSNSSTQMQIICTRIKLRHRFFFIAFFYSHFDRIAISNSLHRHLEYIAFVSDYGIVEIQFSVFEGNVCMCDFSHFADRRQIFTTAIRKIRCKAKV